MEEEFKDVAKFFKADEWNEIDSDDKLRYQTMYNSYNDMIESGFDVPKPFFMNNEEEDDKRTEIDDVADMEKKFKRKCVVESGMRKRAKLEETAASQSDSKRNIPDENEVEISDDRLQGCNVCNKQITDNNHLYSRDCVLIHTGEITYECKVCNRRFTEYNII